MIPLPCGPILVENFEHHMAPLRGPKDIPPAWIVEQNRGQWIAIAEGHPFAQAWRDDPWEAAAACVASVLFWAGRGEPVPACVIQGTPTEPHAPPEHSELLWPPQTEPSAPG